MKKQRRGALYRDVIDAMIYQIGANGVMDIHLEGDLQLGANSIHA